MFKKFTNGSVRIFQNYLPDPFLFCIVLTFVLFLSGMIFTGQGPMNMVNHWSGGFWRLLAFAMQMSLVLILGHTLASAVAFKKILNNLAKVPKSPGQAIVMVTVVSLIACYINWGFGLVIGAIFAKELAKEVDDVDYRVLIASAYSAFLIWHGGLSGSIPLAVASGGEGVVKLTGGVIGAGGIPISETIFSFSNLFIIGVLALTLPLLNKAMLPPKGQEVLVDKNLLIDDNKFVETPKEDMTPADKLENSFLVSMFICLMGFAYIIYYFINKGFSLNLNIVNFIFLFSAIALHKTPKRFLHALSGAVGGAGPIILQFPFYAGIMGMMTGVNSEGVSMAVLISDFFVSVANEFTFPMFTFLSAGIVNFFVPSGGGQWAVQAPVMLPAGAELGVDSAKTAMAIAWGDAWTNMIQPFWALPALGIAGLGAKDIMGFCVIDLLYAGVIISIGLMIGM